LAIGITDLNCGALVSLDEEVTDRSRKVQGVEESDFHSFISNRCADQFTVQITTEK
jgi:hypothetical protein